MGTMFPGAEGLLSNAYVAAGALVGLIAALLRLLARVLDLHERHVVHKEFERLRKLRKVTPACMRLASYLDTSIRTETFRIASGISVSPKKMEYLLELSSIGRWDQYQLRSISRYVRQEPEAIEPSIQVDRSSFWDAIFCIVAGIYFVIVGLFFLVSSGIYLQPPYGWPVGAGICLVFFICALGMWKGVLDYLIAKRAKDYLDWSQCQSKQAEPAVSLSPVTADPA
ncbi:hypothetical protein AAA611_26720 [Pseudomonas aeruginosa]